MCNFKQAGLFDMKITLEKAYTHELSRSVNMTQIKLIIITVQEGSGKK